MALIITIIEVVLLPVFILMILIMFILQMKNKTIFKRLKKYPGVYRKLSRRTFLSHPLSPAFVGFYSKIRFNKRFDKFYFYEDIKKLNDKRTINLINNHRRLTRFFWLLYNIIGLIFIIGFLVVLIIFAVVIMTNGGFR